MRNLFHSRLNENQILLLTAIKSISLIKSGEGYYNATAYNLKYFKNT